jgi:hypothetical protein
VGVTATVKPGGGKVIAERLNRSAATLGNSSETDLAIIENAGAVNDEMLALEAICNGVDRLPGLAAAANRYHKGAEEAATNAVTAAWLAGQALRAAKLACRHGDFQPWIEENFAGSYRTAAAYMRLASNVQASALLETGAQSIDGALKSIRKPRPRPEPPKPKADNATDIAEPLDVVDAIDKVVPSSSVGAGIDAAESEPEELGRLMWCQGQNLAATLDFQIAEIIGPCPDIQFDAAARRAILDVLTKHAEVIVAMFTDADGVIAKIPAIDNDDAIVAAKRVFYAIVDRWGSWAQFDRDRKAPMPADPP